MVEDNRILVSACLAGIQCNYKGEAKPDPRIVELVKRGLAIPVCPEQLGGLTTPRDPAERVAGKVLTKCGKDVTASFQRGADEVCRLACLYGCKKAILKARSPSCGIGETYDGTFTKHFIKRDGVTAEALRKIGVELLTEEDF